MNDIVLYWYVTNFLSHCLCAIIFHSNYHLKKKHKLVDKRGKKNLLKSLLKNAAKMASGNLLITVINLILAVQIFL